MYMSLKCHIYMCAVAERGGTPSAGAPPEMDKPTYATVWYYSALVGLGNYLLAEYNHKKLDNRLQE